jgi:hypothetical protein
LVLASARVHQHFARQHLQQHFALAFGPPQPAGFDLSSPKSIVPEIINWVVREEL